MTDDFVFGLAGDTDMTEAEAREWVERGMWEEEQRRLGAERQPVAAEDEGPF